MRTAHKTKSGPEKKLQTKIFKHLERRGLYVLNVHSGKVQIMKGGRLYWLQLAREGTPDMHFIYRGRPVYLEVKTKEGIRRWRQEWAVYRERKILTDSNRRSIMQHLEHARIRQRGGTVLVCSSVESLDAMLLELDQSKLFQG